MKELVPVLARIAARYIAGALATYGVVAAESEIAVIAAVAIGAAVEGFYAWAKRKGGAT